MITTNWEFNNLNQLTPPSTLTNLTLDNEFNFNPFPISTSSSSNLDLNSQLEQWTNVTFDFDLPLDFNDYPIPSSSTLTSTNDKILLLEEEEKSSQQQLNRINPSSHPSHIPLASTSTSSSYSSLEGQFNHDLLPFGSELDTLTRLTNYNLPNSTTLPLIQTQPFIPYNELIPTPTPTPSTSSSSSSTSPSSTTTTLTKSTSIKPTNPKKRRQSVGPSDIIPSSNFSKDAPSIGVDESDDFPALVLGNDEVANQLAIEEDKRRRNTAASARFRIKKKQREAELQSSAKGLKDRVAELEKEVASLRTENGLLQGLLLKKNDLNTLIKTEQ